MPFLGGKDSVVILLVGQSGQGLITGPRRVNETDSRSESGEAYRSRLVKEQPRRQSSGCCPKR